MPDAPPDASLEARKLPRADRLLEAADRSGLVDRMGHGPVMEAIRTSLDRIRREILAGGPCPPEDRIAGDLVADLGRASRGTLRTVVNATGVVVHTNLGRAPLSEEAVEAMARAARGYTNLEYDLEAGERGDRYGHAEAALRRLTGAGGAVAVNNNAAAVFLALSALARGRPVLVSRGELVAIGGSFKIPEILEASGARLAEVGTTNRTTAADYRRALT
ncbi:MAG TPA: L-seryl-tRNA(Sec) selenium transferase, partial [Anaeromyxobacteraceae bacterium]|nr:L-seryl-tRNA(Sec) selenium transferase [Anaeromyxobacteraceae bacterium]